MENDIKIWLNQGGSYEDGLLLLAKYGRNPHKLNHLMRKRDEVLMRYTLEKLAVIITPTKSADPTIKIVKPIVPAAAPDPEKPSERLKIIREGGIRYSEMPEAIQNVYREACEHYKRMRSLHEKMKIVSSDSARALIRGELVEFSDKHQLCWRAIEKWNADGSLPENSTPELHTEQSGEIITDAKAVNAARVSIGRDLNRIDTVIDDSRKTELMARLKSNVEVIMAAGCGFGKNADKLTELGLISPQ